MQSNWISDNYEEILQWANNMCKGDELATDLAHYAIERFMSHEKYEEIIAHGSEQARPFIIMIMKNSWFGKKSEFSRYYKAHRADIGSRKRVIEDDKFQEILDAQPKEEYNYEKDYIIEAIKGILEEMAIDTKRLWYIGKLFEMWLETPNYSEISRKTGIPRTSIASAVDEAKIYIKQELKNRNINYDF